MVLLQRSAVVTAASSGCFWVLLCWGQPGQLQVPQVLPDAMKREKGAGSAQAAAGVGAAAVAAGAAQPTLQDQSAACSEVEEGWWWEEGRLLARPREKLWPTDSGEGGMYLKGSRLS